MRSTAPSRSFIVALGGERLPYADHPYRNRADIPQQELIVETEWIVPAGAILDAVQALRGKDSPAVRAQRRALQRGLRRIRVAGKNVRGALVAEKRYLWVLDRYGLHFLPELVFYREPGGSPGSDGAPHLRMKHTNITGGGRALLGGEAWFDAVNLRKVYFNAKSGRYGRLGEFKDRVFAFIRELGFLVVDVGDLR